MTRLEQVVVAFVGFSVLLGAYLGYVDEAYFRNSYVVEDSFTEWSTVAALFAAFIVCGRRLWVLRGQRNLGFLATTGFLTVFCLFGAGEEISWGQRIFGFDSPQFFIDNNAQQETGLHNLKIVVGDETYKLNRILFSRGLAVLFFVYLVVMTPLHRKNTAVSSFIDRWGIPMPRNYQIVAYLFVISIAELVIDSSRRGEITEFGGSLIFMLNVAYPLNDTIFEVESGTGADR
ncbi:MAG: hypothetical protein O7E57_03455 [Gammaproteobacteria bacterium]|nr:hypothetical protein [Gammaproteobacteria bacterium]